VRTVLLDVTTACR